MPVLLQGLTINAMTSKERLAPMSKLPVVVVSAMTSVEFWSRDNSQTFDKGRRKLRQSGAYSRGDARLK